MDTFTQEGHAGVTPPPENIDARLLCREVKEIGDVVKTLASTVNAALLNFKDVDNRIQELHSAQTRIVATLEVFQKNFPLSEIPCDAKFVPRTGGGSKGEVDGIDERKKRVKKEKGKCSNGGGSTGNVDGNHESKKRCKKGKGKASYLPNDIMNIEFDISVDQDAIEKKGASVLKSSDLPAKQPHQCPQPFISTVNIPGAANKAKATMNPRFCKTLRGVTSVEVFKTC